MAKLQRRNPLSAPGEWYIDTDCIDCGASRHVAHDLIVHRHGKSVFARQPAGDEDERAAWRAVLVCPTASVGTVSHRTQPEGVFPQELAPGVFRCGYNARESFGAHSFFVRREPGNFMVDSPRFVNRLVKALESMGGVHDILLTHRDDVADAGKFAAHFGARVWIHDDDADAAPYATNILRGEDAVAVREGLLAIPVPGHTRGSSVYLLEDTYLFTGDSLAWDREAHDLEAFRDACWYSWTALKRSLATLLDHRFAWVLAGHGDSVHLSRDEMHQRLRDLVDRM